MSRLSNASTKLCLITFISLVQKSSMLAVEDNFYRRFKLKNACGKKLAYQTQKPFVKINFYWRFLKKTASEN